MRTAETVLSIIHDRGTRGLPLEDVYRQLFNPDLYLRAYARLYRNDGAMTPGTTLETVDGMTMAKIDAIIDAVRHERYRWTPAKRVYIPKKNGKMRPLGLPTWSDKLLQEVMRSILEAYYEPQFSDRSHGFRPNRGCHTALSKVKHTWNGTRWFIEGDISDCFGSLDHEVLLRILGEKIHDNRFLRLIRGLLQAGYLEDWTWHATLSGSPQGGVVSPILSNIYLDKFDKFVEQTLLPLYNRGQSRQINGQYRIIQKRMIRKRTAGHTQEAKALRRELQRLPWGDPNDPNYRRLRYVRYADDWLLGFAGPHTEAEEIKRLAKDFLRDELKLELSDEKTLITHAATQAARFLGYDIVMQHGDDQHDREGKRCINGRIGLRVPKGVVEKRCALYMKRNKPTHRPELLLDSDYTIIDRYQSEYRGVVQYYLLAYNVSALGKLRWVMERSLVRTLACKHKTTVRKVLRKHRSTVQTPHGPMRCLKVTVERNGDKAPLVAYFGGIPLRRQTQAIIRDAVPLRFDGSRTELVERLLANTCELCGWKGNCEVHHIRKLADLKAQGRREKPTWVKRMAARRRKTLVVCSDCHTAIHAGRPTRQKRQDSVTGEPDESKGSRPVRGGADGKVPALSR